ncbi:type IV-A pilus assembly ATPase PilB [Thiohalospira sp.]|uniref:type IV-A pilus assembly ATPase PilB n=1 Tax=Thiohalospira sp. TaxID=3080549 RepID=UPI00397F6209
MTTGTPQGITAELVAAGQLDAESARAAESTTGSRVEHLVGELGLPATAVAEAAGRAFGLPVVDLTAVEPLPEALEGLRPDLLRRHRLLPFFRRGQRLAVALADPGLLHGLDELQFQAGVTAEAVVAPRDQIEPALEAALAGQEQGLDEGSEGAGELDELDSIGVDAAAGADTDDPAAEGVDEAPVVRFINRILLDAIRRGASDIHFEPFEDSYRIRERMDGVLRTIARPPVAQAHRLAARLKVMARLDISERRLPQDGRMKVRITRNRAVDFRVSTLPTLFGEKVVLRILDPMAASLDVDSLGLDESQKGHFLSALDRPQGMVLVTGPTGSGKTMTLYTALGLLNDDRRNIATAEDPAEINLPGVNQVNVNPRAGLDFAAALRSFLRQDPDIIMVGEIRDLETAEIGIKAAQTGHLVLSTLHTNDAPQTLARLVNMGVPTYNIATSVSLIVAQRLARRLCDHCKQPREIPASALEAAGFTEAEAAEVRPFGPVGCEHCNEGYRGRVGVFQVMPVSDEMARLIMEGSDALALATRAEEEGIRDLRRSGLDKVAAGVTSLEEIERVTRE